MAVLHKTITMYRCEQCGHEWTPRGEKAPQVCPNRGCKSRHWNRPKPGAAAKRKPRTVIVI
jgi:hypothetical protein